MNSVEYYSYSLTKRQLLTARHAECLWRHYVITIVSCQSTYGNWAKLGQDGLYSHARRRRTTRRHQRIVTRAIIRGSGSGVFPGN